MIVSPVNIAKPVPVAVIQVSSLILTQKNSLPNEIVAISFLYLFLSGKKLLLCGL